MNRVSILVENGNPMVILPIGTCRIPESANRGFWGFIAGCTQFGARFLEFQLGKGSDGHCHLWSWSERSESLSSWNLRNSTTTQKLRNGDESCHIVMNLGNLQALPETSSLSDENASAGVSKAKGS